MTGGYMGPGGGLDRTEKIKISFPTANRTALVVRRIPVTTLKYEFFYILNDTFVNAK
jgi:hypothetical protein